MLTTDITNDFWQYVEDQKHKTKIAQKVYNWLNYDNLNAIILDDKVFWWEINNSQTNTTPNFIYHYIKAWGKRQGFTYVFDL